MYDVYERKYKKELKPDFSNENQIKDFCEGINKIKDTFVSIPIIKRIFRSSWH